MKYIDADKLKAEIERRIELLKKLKKNDFTDGSIDAYKGILILIASLQQEQTEADLEQFDKDVTEIWGRCAAESNDSIACLHIETFIEVARHFWNKGYNTRTNQNYFRYDTQRNVNPRGCKKGI